MVSKKMRKRQETWRRELATKFFGECTGSDFMITDKGHSGIVRIGRTTVTKVYYGGGGAFGVPSFTVIRYDSIHGATYDQSIGAEEVTLHTTFGNVTWNLYEANLFVLQLLREIAGDAGVSSLEEALERTAEVKGLMQGRRRE